MSFDSLSDILKKQVGNRAVNTKTMQDIFATFRATANTILPKELRSAYAISHLNGSILYIEVTHSAYSQEISVYKHVILRRLAMQSNKILITDIRIQQKRT